MEFLIYCVGATIVCGDNHDVLRLLYYPPEDRRLLADLIPSVVPTPSHNVHIIPPIAKTDFDAKGEDNEEYSDISIETGTITAGIMEIIIIKKNYWINEE